MLTRKELSDRIGKLFCLRKGEFDPEIHVPVANEIVDALGLDTDHFFRLSDFFSFYFHTSNRDSNTKHTINYGPELDGLSGVYNVRHLGRLAESTRLGLYPKLRINHWKSEVFSFPEDGEELIDISYKGKEVMGIRRYFICNDNALRLGPLKLIFPREGEVWRYRK